MARRRAGRSVRPMFRSIVIGYDAPDRGDEAIALAEVLRDPRKGTLLLTSAYTTYVAPEKYAQMAWVHGLGGRSAEGRRARLFTRVEALLDDVGIPRSLADAGVGEAEFEAALPELAEAAFMDPSMRTNPRMPLVAELVDLLRAGWTGRSAIGTS